MGDNQNVLNVLQKLPMLDFAGSRDDIKELAQLYRRAVASKDERLAATATEAAGLIADSESASVQAMHWRDIGLAVVGEPVAGMPNIADFASPTEAAVANYVAGEGGAAKASYMREFLIAALRHEP